MSTEEPQAERHTDPPDDGSPITVGGGGGFVREKNRCTFDEDDYPDPEPGGNPKKKIFQHAGWQIRTFKIHTTLRGTEDHSGLLPLNGDCEIEVRCKSSGDDVTIISDAKGFGIDMDTSTYRDKPTLTVHENPDETSYVYEVELKGKRKWKFDRVAECTVCTDHIENSPNCFKETES